MKSEKIVVYLVNEHVFFQKMARNSISMLRTHNSSLPVVLYIIEDERKLTINRSTVLDSEPIDIDAFCKEHDVEVRRRKPAVFPGDENYFFVQRWWLCECKEERVLHLDADTFIFGDVEKLFDKYSSFDPEWDIECDLVACGNDWVWGYDWKENLLEIPPVNAGVTLWNNGWLRRYSEVLPMLSSEIRDGNGPLTDWLYARNSDCLHREEFALSVYAGREKLKVLHFQDDEVRVSRNDQDIYKAQDSLIYHSYTSLWPEVHRILNEPEKKKVYSFVRKK